jgi:hypothetical protein
LRRIPATHLEASCPGKPPSPSKENVDSALKMPVIQQRRRLDGAYAGVSLDKDRHGPFLQKSDSSDKVKHVWGSIVGFHFRCRWSC